MNRITLSVFVSLALGVAVALGQGSGYPNPDCNSSALDAGGGDCGTATPCGAWSGAGSCTGTATGSQTLQDSCVTGTASDYCEDIPGTGYDCTRTYSCVHGTVPNPTHDPTDPSSPAVLDACETGTNQGTNSFMNRGNSKICNDQT
jgi:hypothetical protein